MVEQSITIKFARIQAVKLPSFSLHTIKNTEMYLWSADIIYLTYFLCELVEAHLKSQIMSLLHIQDRLEGY